MPTTPTTRNKRPKIELAPELIEWMAEQPAFLYPELLPISALKPSGKNDKDSKPYFAKSEDNLIALGKFYKLFLVKRLHIDLAIDGFYHLEWLD